MKTETAQTDRAATAGHLRRFLQDVADFLHSLHCDFQRVFVHLRPSGGTATLNLGPRLEGQLLRIRQRRPMIEKCPTASTAQDRCPACNCFATLQELLERQTPETASALPSRSIVPWTDCQPGQHQTEVAERAGPMVFLEDSPLLSFEIVVGQVLRWQTNDHGHRAAADDLNFK